MRGYEFLEKIPNDRDYLVLALRTIQGAKGYLPDDAISIVAEYFGISVKDVESVIGFYPALTRVPPGRWRLTVCDGTACRRKRGGELLEVIRRELGLTLENPTTGNRLFSLETSRCLGACNRAPVLLVNDERYDNMTPQKLKQLTKLRDSTPAE